MRVAPVARLSQLGCLCLTTWIVVTMRVPAMLETPRGGSGEIRNSCTPIQPHSVPPRLPPQILLTVRRSPKLKWARRDEHLVRYGDVPVHTWRSP